MTTREPDLVLLPLVAEEQPQLLLEAFTAGRYAAAVGYRADNPYTGQMAEAWLQGWRHVEGEA